MSDSIASTSYSTIFHCTEGAFVCFLRLLEGIVSTLMLMLFVRGYQVISRQQNNQLSKEDKSIYLLGLLQTLFLSLYYLVFEEFFMLATIRNLLIWANVNILHVFCKIYWINNHEVLRKVNLLSNVLKVANFLLWFVISLGDGTALVNTSFNLGYNCKLIDWMVISGLLLIVTLFELYIGFQIGQKLKWELKNTPADHKAAIESIETEKTDIMMLVGANTLGSLIMFFWDFVAYMMSTSDQSCTDLFSGNSFFRNILCFLLKVITMQLAPCVIYYTFYFKRKNQFMETHQVQAQQLGDVDYLADDAASDLNRTLMSRISSRKSLFSDKDRNGSQYF